MDPVCIFLRSHICHCCFDNGYEGKQPVAWKEYCAEYWLKELQESIDRCTAYHDITEILLKTALNTIQLINFIFINHASWLHACSLCIIEDMELTIFVLLGAEENGDRLTLFETSPGFYMSAVRVIGKHYRKRRNCSLRAISPFPIVFSTRLESFQLFSSSLTLSSVNSLFGRV